MRRPFFLNKTTAHTLIQMLVNENEKDEVYVTTLTCDHYTADHQKSDLRIKLHNENQLSVKTELLHHMLLFYTYAPPPPSRI